MIGIFVDNAAANRKFYKEFLCGGCWQSSIKNSFSGGRIFLLFDPTHIVKNIYNNFLTKKVFKMPMLSPILSQNLTAKFSDIKNVTILNVTTTQNINIHNKICLFENCHHDAWHCNYYTKKYT